MLYTVWCCYNVVNNLPQIVTRHWINHPQGQDIGCLLWVRTSGLSQSLQCCTQYMYHVIWQHPFVVLCAVHVTHWGRETLICVSKLIIIGSDNGLSPGPQSNIKMSSYQYRKCRCGDKTVVRSSYLHNVISYTGKMSSLYWIRALASAKPLSRTNAWISLIGPLGINLSEVLMEIHILSFKKMYLIMSSGKWRPFCLGLNVLTPCGLLSS